MALYQPTVLMVGNFLSSVKSTRFLCEELSERLELSGWTVIGVSRKQPSVMRVSDMVATVWRQRRRYDVAHVDVYSSRAFLWAEAVCCILRWLKKPYVLTLRGGGLPALARRRRRRFQRMMEGARLITSPSNFMLEQMKAYRTDLQLLPNPLELKNYPFRLRKKTAPRLVWLRAFHKFYNPLLALQVVALLLKQFPGVTLTMIGPIIDRDLKRDLENSARELGVVRRVTFVAGVAKPEVPEWLSKGDIFLNTSSVDNTPVSVMEAMACGLCVVSTKVGGIPYMLDDESTAMLVPHDDAGAMADAVQKLLLNPDLAERLSGNGRNEVSKFDWSHVLPQWKSLLSEAADIHTSP